MANSPSHDWPRLSTSRSSAHLKGKTSLFNALTGKRQKVAITRA
jgi:hypothetical protein